MKSGECSYYVQRGKCNLETGHAYESLVDFHEAHLIRHKCDSRDRDQINSLLDKSISKAMEGKIFLTGF